MNLPTGGRRYPCIFLFIFPCVCLSACKFAINDVSTCLFGSASIYFLIGVFTCTYLSIYLPIYVWVMLLYAKDQVVEYSVGIFSLGIRADCIPAPTLPMFQGLAVCNRMWCKKAIWRYTPELLTLGWYSFVLVNLHWWGQPQMGQGQRWKETLCTDVLKDSLRNWISTRWVRA